MTSNKEWLNNLAATDPQALQAWFDAPRGGLDAPCDDCEQVDGNHSKADSDDSSVTQKESVSLRDCFGILSDSTKSSEKLRNEEDSCEQLEHDIDVWLDYWIGWSIPKDKLYLTIVEWLGRQEAITTRQLSDRQIMQECKDWERWCKDAERKCSELQAELEKQTADYADVITAQIEQLREISKRKAELQAERDRYREIASELLDAAHNMQLIADGGLA